MTPHIRKSLFYLVTAVYLIPAEALLCEPVDSTIIAHMLSMAGVLGEDTIIFFQPSNPHR